MTISSSQLLQTFMLPILVWISRRQEAARMKAQAAALAQITFPVTQLCRWTLVKKTGGSFRFQTPQIAVRPPWPLAVGEGV